MSATRRPASLFALLLALLASLALVTSACSDDSSDKDSAKKTTTTTEKKSTDTSESTTTISDDEFATSLDKATADLNAAQGPCDIAKAVQSIEVGSPTSKAQVQKTAEFFTLLANTIAKNTDDSTLAQSLKDGATSIEDYAKSVDYDPQKLSNAEAFPAEAKAVNDSISNYLQAQLAACSQSAGSSTTAAP
jgi:hypothetical protein